MVNASAAHCWYIWVEGEICQILLQHSKQILLGQFDTENLIRKHREVFAPLSFVLDKEEFSFIWLQFHCLFIDIHDWTEAKLDCKSFCGTAESPDAKETYN